IVIIIFLLLISTSASIDNTTCGETKDCLFSPPGCTPSTCAYFLSLTSEDEWTIFEVSTTNVSRKTNYLAVGMSDDDAMGEEPVTFCFFPESGAPSVNVGYNNGKSNTVADDSLKPLLTKNVELLHAEKTDNTLICSFRQRIQPSEEHEMLPDLSKKYTVLMARGAAKSPTHLGIHGLTPNLADFPFISPSSINLTHFYSSAPSTTLPSMEAESTTDASTSSSSPSPSSTAPSGLFDFSKESRLFMIRIHGILMIIPWLFLIPSAIFSARYLRNEWRLYSPGGIKIWFHIHRSLNWISLLFLVVATLLVLMAKDFLWKGPWPGKPKGKQASPGSIHSLLGAVSLVCTLLQIAFALVRPSPDSKIRPYFNGIHRVVGLVSLIFAIPTTLIASFYFLKYWNDQSTAFLLTIASTLLIGLAFILFEVVRRYKQKRELEEIEMDGGKTAIRVESQLENILTKLVFILFCLSSCALIALIVLNLIA
ncbi:hypothetical protein PFISCL1PPCAC_11825, partial [Pristionchus fissidentatus]